MLALIAALALTRSDSVTDLPESTGSASLAQIKVVGTALDPPKSTPRPVGNAPEQMPWLTEALTRTEATDPFALKFDVFSAERTDISSQVARMMARLWQLIHKRWRYDNPSQYRNGVVNVFLCQGGAPGGEQFFGYEDPPHGRGFPINAICIYDMKSFIKPIEMAREVAHEYGHAVLPPIGGFVHPEEWAGGFLGERLFLRWMRDALQAKSLDSADAMGVDLAMLDSWVKTKVDPLILEAAANGPNSKVLHGTGPEAMAAYHGLVLYADTIMPRMVAARSMLLTGTTHAWDYPHGLLMATQELDRFALNIPPYLRGRPLWVPLAKGKVTGATVLKRSGEWAQIQPGPGAVQLFPAMPSN